MRSWHRGLQYMLFVDFFSEFKFDGFSADTCRSLVALKDVSVLNF